jgi:hypothetical protein
MRPKVFGGRGLRTKNGIKARTGLLFLDRQLLPAALHTITEGHPEVGLLLEGHALPSLLNVGKSRVGDGVG